MITPIDARDVSRITSGQVIIELVSVAKELVDNAIDAGADKIEVTFGEYGTKFLEVTDNGCGIDPSDYGALCLKYHTSKLSSFEDLTLVASLGFRGEAMSSLCSVATVVVSTSSATTFPRSAQLQYDNVGKLTSKKSSVSGKKGTSVTITDLFRSLPVRHKNFVKHSKREYSKALSLIMAYSLAYTNIRFTVFSISALGKRQMVMGTPGGLVLLNDVMVNVYGSNGAHGLIPLEIIADDIETHFKLKLDYSPSRLSFKLVGAISDCSFGMGRSATDRQFLSINKRPVIHKRFSKVINDVYRSFNTTQSPVFVLDLQLGPHFIDVNITPDKRSVMVHTEELILDVIREELSNFYAVRNNIVPKSHVVNMSSSQGADQCILRKQSSREVETIKEQLEFDVHSEDENKQNKYDSEKNADNGATESEILTGQSLFISDQDLVEESIENDETARSGMGSTNVHDEVSESSPEFEDVKKFEIANIKSKTAIPIEVVQSQEILNEEKSEIYSQAGASSRCTFDSPEKVTYNIGDPLQQNSHIDDADTTFENPAVQGDLEVLAEHSNENKSHLVKEKFQNRTQLGLSSAQCDTSKGMFTLRAEFSVNLSDLLLGCNKNGAYKSKDLAELGDITQTMEIKKADFCNMSLVGQFNSGFIIVTHRTRLFIVDQHALDEIYNYERLMKSLVLRAQPLVVPRRLELSPIDEMRTLEYAEQLRKNGFQIEEDKEAPPGRKVQLVAVPVLKNVVFDDADLHELVTKLHENCSLGKKGVMATVRCTKTEKTIALRACRLSIMIGLALLSLTMNQVVLHLSNLDRPWNCPHGRPTIRHLADLEGLGFQDDYIL